MGLFRRNNNDAPKDDPALTELGREFAIAKRHGDRKRVRQVMREIDSTCVTGADWDAVARGQAAYDAIPPGYSKPRRGRRR